MLTIKRLAIDTYPENTAFRRLALPEGASVAIEQAMPPPNLEFVRRNIDGDTLQDDEVSAIIRDIAAHRYSPMEIGAFLVACAGFIVRVMILFGRKLSAPLCRRYKYMSPLVARGRHGKRKMLMRNGQDSMRTMAILATALLAVACKPPSRRTLPPSTPMHRASITPRRSPRCPSRPATPSSSAPSAMQACRARPS
jgi:hypothetical protein